MRCAMHLEVVLWDSRKTGALAKNAAGFARAARRGLIEMAPKNSNQLERSATHSDPSCGAMCDGHLPGRGAHQRPDTPPICGADDHRRGGGLDPNRPCGTNRDRPVHPCGYRGAALVARPDQPPPRQGGWQGLCHQADRPGLEGPARCRAWSGCSGFPPLSTLPPAKRQEFLDILHTIVSAARK